MLPKRDDLPRRRLEETELSKENCDAEPPWPASHFEYCYAVMSLHNSSVLKLISKNYRIKVIFCMEGEKPIGIAPIELT